MVGRDFDTTPHAPDSPRGIEEARRLHPTVPGQIPSEPRAIVPAPGEPVEPVEAKIVTVDGRRPRHQRLLRGI